MYKVTFTVCVNTGVKLSENRKAEITTPILTCTHFLEYKCTTWLCYQKQFNGQL